MTQLKTILTYNHTFVENKIYEQYETSKFPNKKMVILSCMDTRLIELLPAAMNLKNGDAKIIKNAGAVLSHPFGSAMRSILVALYELKAEEVYVIGHHGCGMSAVNTESMVQKMKDRGIEESTMDTLVHAGIDMHHWLHGFDDVHTSVSESVDMIQKHPLLPPNTKVHGLIIDPSTGKLDVVVNGDI